MKWVGSYRSAVNTERKPGELVGYRGRRAMVRFHDGQTYTMQADPLRREDISPGERFMLVVRRQGGQIVDVNVQRIAEARPPRQRPTTPKIQVRRGKRLVTRNRR